MCGAAFLVQLSVVAAAHGHQCHQSSVVLWCSCVHCSLFILVDRLITVHNGVSISHLTKLRRNAVCINFALTVVATVDSRFGLGGDNTIRVDRTFLYTAYVVSKNMRYERTIDTGFTTHLNINRRQHDNTRTRAHTPRTCPMPYSTTTCFLANLYDYVALGI